jgi:hypothetical protein
VKTVEYNGFTYRYPRIEFSYSWDGRQYNRQVDLGNLSRVLSERADALVRDRLIAHVGLTIAREFFRLDRIERIVARTPHFFPESAAFFESWLRAGLAELRYVNGIPLDEPIEIVIDQPQTPEPMECAGSGILLCNGGGKDSVVAAEALHYAGVPFTWLSLSPTPAMEGLQSISGAPELHVHHGLGRTEMRAEKRIGGHLPFLPMVAAMGTLVAHLQNFASVAVANEYSANFANLDHYGFPVNHQYGKSLEFENLFRGYLARNLTGISYFSVLQPFYELQVAQAFAKLPQYFEAFKSCNGGHRRDKWCRRCAKCAFIYLTLSPFLDEAEILRIFGGDPWREVRVRETIRDLVSGARKPFECVGTFDEARHAARLMLQNRRGPGARPEIAAALRDWLPTQNDPHTAATLMGGHRSRPHNIPTALWPRMAEFFEAKAAQPDQPKRHERPARVLILSASAHRRLFELDMAGRLLLQALDHGGIEWALHCPWLPLPDGASFVGVLTWSFRYDENNFVYWARKAEAFYRAAGLRIVNSIETFSNQHSWYLSRWREAGIRCARFERFSDVDTITLPYPMILRCDGLHKGRNTYLVQSRTEAQRALEETRAEGVAVDLALEFIDLRFPDGYYRNRFVFVAGNNVIPRQHAIGRDWLLNFETAEASPQSVREDREFRQHGEPCSELVLRAARATGADIVGLDYGISPRGDYVFWEGHRHFKMTGDAGYRTGKLESATGRPAAARAADDEDLGNAMAELLRAEFFPIAAVA